MPLKKARPSFYATLVALVALLGITNVLMGWDPRLQSESSRPPLRPLGEVQAADGVRQAPFAAQSGVRGLEEGSRPRAHGTPNPVVLQLSQGRSGSTVSGSLLLGNHPSCGMYIDELLWAVYKKRVRGQQEEDADQQVAVDVFLNATQCDMSPEVYTDEQSVLGWFVKRDRYGSAKAEGEYNSPDFYTRSNQLRLCNAARARHQAVCGKEIRFLGHTRQLMQSAERRGIPLTIVYQMRDPRASVLSQLWAFWNLRYKENRDESKQAADMLREHCRIGVLDLGDLSERFAGVTAVQLCFEDLHMSPQATLKAVYAKIPGLADFAGAGQGVGLIPDGVAEYGRTHMAMWDNSSDQVDLGSISATTSQTVVQWKGQAISHRYSTDMSRAKHVMAWRGDINLPRYDELRRVWDGDAHCRRLRVLSECSRVWTDVEPSEGGGGGSKEGRKRRSGGVKRGAGGR